MERHKSNEVDLFLRRALVVVLVVLLAGTVLLFVYGSYFTSRLDSFEQQLKYRNPTESDESQPSDPLTVESAQSETPNAVQGQTIYVPAYSHVYHQEGNPHLLTVTLSIRNTSIDHEISIDSVRYFDTQGVENAEQEVELTGAGVSFQALGPLGVAEAIEIDGDHLEVAG